MSDVGYRSLADIQVDQAGQVWLATTTAGLLRYTAQAGFQVLWQAHTTVNGAAPQPIQVDQALTAAYLATTGKFYLEAALSTNLGQPLGLARYPFYVFPTHTGLTFGPEQSIYQPGQTLSLTGQVLNGATQPLTHQNLTVWLNHQPIYTVTNLTVPAQATYPFNLTAPLPAQPGLVSLKAQLNDFSVAESVRLVPAQVETYLSTPPLVGYAPFDLRVFLNRVLFNIIHHYTNNKIHHTN